MAKRKNRKREEEKASPDLTPMIDVTFQLLIFFILCTRFKVDERNHRADLPLDEGLNTSQTEPKEQITIYCNWDQGSLTNQYFVAIGARGRKLVQDSQASLSEIVILQSDNNSQIAAKKALYRQIFENLSAAIENYIERSGAKIEKIEISFAVDAVQGASSGTAPWMYVALAIDCCTNVNNHRKEKGLEPLGVTFKFVDAQNRFAGSK